MATATDNYSILAKLQYQVYTENNVLLATTSVDYYTSQIQFGVYDPMAHHVVLTCFSGTSDSNYTETFTESQTNYGVMVPWQNTASVQIFGFNLDNSNRSVDELLNILNDEEAEIAVYKVQDIFTDDNIDYIVTDDMYTVGTDSSMNTYIGFNLTWEDKMISLKPLDLTKFSSTQSGYVPPAVAQAWTPELYSAGN